MINENSPLTFLDYFFHPRSIVVIGVSPGVDENRFGGQYFLRSLVAAAYPGRLYAVGIEDGDYRGIKVYPRITDIPDDIDYAIIAAPARAVPQILRECVEKHVPAAHVFSAGFGELGDETGYMLESELAGIARQGKIRFIGPNCMGIYCPGCGLSFNHKFTTKKGSLAFVSQSGSNAEYAVQMGMRRGVYFSKVVSYGNGVDVAESDLLEYLAADPETKVIVLYIEGVRDGRRFFKVLRQAARRKPVIIYKGGTTETGARTVLSHTSALTGSAVVWKTAINQAGAIMANDIDEFLDLALLFNYTEFPADRNIAVIGIGGGFSVFAADNLASAGLNLPRFSPELRQSLKQLFGSEAGASYKNPVEVFGWNTLQKLPDVIRLVAASKETDNILVHLPVGFVNAVTPGMVESEVDLLTTLPPEIKKHTVIVLFALFTPEDAGINIRLEKKLAEAGLPVFPSVPRAANALSKFIQYNS